ncbi:MAG TPA: PIG-L deacetylase family protein [Actinomycetota bacterium]
MIQADDQTPDAAAPGPVLAVFAHPDDAEISSGGTLAKWASAGREVHLLVLTNGDRGSGDPTLDRAELARIRARETAAAAAVLGLAGARVLSTPDGELENTPEVREELVRAIRTIRPTTLLSCDPTAWFFRSLQGTTTYYNHSDHRTAGVIALDAVFPGAGNPHFFSEHLAQGLQSWDVKDIWLGWTNEPNHFEDVTGFFDAKVRALGEHQSQIDEGIRFWDEWMREEAVAAGARIGAEFAEEFRVLDLS